MLKFSRLSKYVWNEKPSLFVKNVPYDASLQEFQKIAPGLIQVEQPKVKYLSKQIYLRFDHLADAAQWANGIRHICSAVFEISNFCRQVFKTKAHYA